MTTCPDVHPIIRQIVDRLHVGMSDREVLRVVRSKFDRRFLDLDHKTWRRTAYRDALAQHNHNRDIYRFVARGFK